jgi:hypothetical protein
MDTTLFTGGKVELCEMAALSLVTVWFPHKRESET